MPPLGDDLSTNLATDLARAASQQSEDSDPDELIEGLGENVLWWYEPREATLTFDTGEVDSMAPLGGEDAPTLAADDADDRPEWAESDGPNSTPELVISSNNNLLGSGLGISGGNRTSVYAVYRVPGGSTLRVVCGIDGARGYFGQNNSGFSQRANFSGGLQAPTITDPAFSTSYIFGAVRPLSTGALCQIGGMTTIPNYTGSDTLEAFDDLRVGLNTFSGGGLAFFLGLEDGSAEFDQVVRAYVEARFGL